MGAPNPCRGKNGELMLVLLRGHNEAHLQELEELQTGFSHFYRRKLPLLGGGGD